jgi:hypothetical protein
LGLKRRRWDLNVDIVIIVGNRGDEGDGGDGGDEGDGEAVGAGFTINL